MILYIKVGTSNHDIISILFIKMQRERAFYAALEYKSKTIRKEERNGRRQTFYHTIHNNSEN